MQQLYAGTSRQFYDDTTQQQIAEKLKQSFFQKYRHKPSEGEYRSWQHSLQSLTLAMMSARLDDHGIILEYELPLSSLRLDAMITGEDSSSASKAVIVELKQWSEASASDTEGCVGAYVGGKERQVLHPSVQADQYRQYLSDVHTVFTSGDVTLESCSYLHNMQLPNAYNLLNPSFDAVLKRTPLFVSGQTEELSDYFNKHLSNGKGHAVLGKVLESRFRPSLKLMDHVTEMVNNQSHFVLLDDQLIVMNTVLKEIKTASRSGKKTVVLVQGGPGSGKSVVALHLIGALSKLGLVTYHATGSRAFTGAIQSVVGARAAKLFSYYRQFAKAENGEVDVLICDEAHRIRETSTNQWTKAVDRSGLPQIDELVRAAKVGVFLLDDNQVVRPDEEGSSALVREAAGRWDAELKEFELEAQFRCAGSQGYVNWVDNTLGIRRTANILLSSDDAIDFNIVDSIYELEVTVRQKALEGSARMAAGFCWQWSKPNADGTLVDDVVVGEWARPWNANSQEKAKLAKGIPPEVRWAIDPNGIDQVGCVYTAQGFEFDHIGVIWGRDLRYDPKLGDWIADKEVSHDRAVRRSKDFVALIKNTYRILLTRGMKSCHVYFEDEDTRNFVRSRLERV